MPLKIYAGRSKKQHSAIFEMCFELLTFGIVILYTTKQYKVKSNYKRVSNRYKYSTVLSRLRASSLANSRPTFAQICVINLLPMLRAILGMSTKSNGDRLKFGLFTTFACVQPAFKNAAAVPREASRAQKSPCPAMTSSSASTSPSICSKVLDMFSVEGVNFSALAPTELKTFFSRCTQRLPKSKHIFRSSFKDCCNFVFSAALASYFDCKFFLSCSKLSDFCRSSPFNLVFSAFASTKEPSIAWSKKSFFSREASYSLILFYKPSIIISFFLSSRSCCICSALLSSILCINKPSLANLLLHKNKKFFASSQEFYLKVGIKQTTDDMLSSVAPNIGFKLRKTDTL
jgi:hypothetical protein